MFLPDTFSLSPQFFYVTRSTLPGPPRAPTTLWAQERGQEARGSQRYPLSPEPILDFDCPHSAQNALSRLQLETGTVYLSLFLTTPRIRNVADAEFVSYMILQ